MPQLGQVAKLDSRNRNVARVGYQDPEILVGKPVVKGTRLSVDFLLRLFAVGWTEKQVLENYPTLTSDALRAVFAFAAECMGEEAMFTMPVGSAYAISG
jgi:uncharacterized protein (DUF433 family)